MKPCQQCGGRGDYAIGLHEDGREQVQCERCSGTGSARVP